MLNEALERNEEPFLSYYKLSKLINEHRNSLNMETPEVRLKLGEKMAISTKFGTKSTKMIEIFMVTANQAIGNLFFRAKVPGIYRCHPIAEKDDVEQFNGKMQILSLPLEIKLPERKVDPEIKAKKELGSSELGGGFGGLDKLALKMRKGKKKKEEKPLVPEKELGKPLISGVAQLNELELKELLIPFTKVLSAISDINYPELQRLSFLSVLQTFTFAFYTSGNMGHFGLGLKRYVHFTSPIRRYPDILAHRICKQLIKLGLNERKAEDLEINFEDLIYPLDEIDEVTEHSSEQSLIASRLERRIVGAGYSFLARKEEAKNKIGVVSRIRAGSIFVLLPNGIDVRVPLFQMTKLPHLLMKVNLYVSLLVVENLI